MFDCLVTKRQRSLLTTARKQNALVASLFPVSATYVICMMKRQLQLTTLSSIVAMFPQKSIQKKLMDDIEEAEKTKLKWNKSGTAGLRSYLNEDIMAPNKKYSKNDIEAAGTGTASKPIADLFPETTIMFADIAGFTAWSSTREPSHVFTLLESVYHDFDTIAKRRRVFKVEVVGDCYVAVAGLPDPRPVSYLYMTEKTLYQLY
jgi:hypothetical protein